jgi:hypothetical protein
MDPTIRAKDSSTASFPAGKYFNIASAESI